MRSTRFRHFFCLIAALAASAPFHAQDRHVPAAVFPPVQGVLGPYNVHVLAGGPGINKPLPETSAYLDPASPYTLLLWIEMTEAIPANTLLAGLGDPAQESARFLALVGGHPALRYGPSNQIVASEAVSRKGWHLLAASFDGTTDHLYVDSLQAATGVLPDAAVSPQLALAPAPPEPLFEHFGGNLTLVTVFPRALSATEIATIAATPPATVLLRYEEASPTWPVQTHAQAGYAEPQDPSTLPHSRALLPNSLPRAISPTADAALVPAGRNRWTLSNGWELASATDVTSSPAQIASAFFGEAQKTWLRATVPGTVLTTYVDRGVYPDPDFGLNNLVIPESLNQHDYWYRVRFDTPAGAFGRHLTLTFNGINYAAEVWLNGQRLGNIKGAFIRGSFDISKLTSRFSTNVLAVRISPPPHPGIPQEQSILGGPGENGGIECLDGPTFVATEGWDWIPAIRDRNTGIWQDVVLSVTGDLHLGDPQVVSHLPLPDTSSADVAITLPVTNHASTTQSATLTASFEGVTVTKSLSLPPGESRVLLSPSEFPQLHVPNPRLWWPNGYGAPELYHLKLALGTEKNQSDEKSLTFGIREVSYELTVFDPTGNLRRVVYDPASSKLTSSTMPLDDPIDVSHAGLHHTAEFWAPSLTSGGEQSPAVHSIPNPQQLKDLTLRVNGVRIAARGGNWGMDDSRKRVSREHLEPFFRLHREAGLNIIRNWVGQDTEETFYQLADEYGLMVWNDFWASTQDYNLEPQDVPLFLANARDVVRRFRNHPSIVVWCGRNEGVPQPILNDGLIQLFREEDGTRYYTPGSNRIDLRNSGPYKYQDPAQYYAIDQGFSVELGIASLSTLESLRASIAPPDLWPISDAWAYHDWHASGNGDTHPLMNAIDRQLGAATSLEDFERKAQLFNYVDHRAIFEGFNQHLFTPNSGRMLWMTQPAWPSNMWQIFSSDYDTNASFYGVKKATEPLHIQLSLADYKLAAINTTNAAAPDLQVTATVFSLGGDHPNQVLLSREQSLDLPANAAVPLFELPIRQFLPSEATVLVRLTLARASGAVLSANTYWLAASDPGYRKLLTLPPVTLTAAAAEHIDVDSHESVVELTLSNPSQTTALMAKGTLVDAKTHARILPAYFSDNYVTLLPAETVHLTVRAPLSPNRKQMTLRGFNISPQTIEVVR